MRLLLAGGVFRLSALEQSRRQAAPEIVLAGALSSRGVEVTTVPLENLRQIALSKRFDLVHVHHLSKAATLAAASPLAPPLVYTAHGMAPPPNRRVHLGERFVMLRASARVCLSRAEETVVAAAYPAARSRLHVIPNGFDLPSDAVAQRRLGPGGPIRALFVGQLIPVKQVERLVHALAFHPRMSIRVVTHNTLLLSQLNLEAERQGVANRLHVVGQLSGERLFEEYRKADLLLLPSKSEALPTVVFEALSQALPVVASAVGGVPEQVGDAGVLTDPNSIESFVKGIETALARYERLAASAYARADRVREEFSISKMADRHVRLYNQLLEGVQ